MTDGKQVVVADMGMHKATASLAMATEMAMAKGSAAASSAATQQNRR